MICGGREEREPVSPPRTLQNYHIDAENDKEMALLETKLRYCLEENMTGYGEYTQYWWAERVEGPGKGVLH